MAGLGVFGALLWAFGKREVLEFRGHEMRLVRRLGPIQHKHSFDATSIRDPRLSGMGLPVVRDLAAIAAFWDRGAGRIAFDVDERTYAFGVDLDDSAAFEVLNVMETWMPVAGVALSDVEPDKPDSSRRRSDGRPG